METRDCAAVSCAAREPAIKFRTARASRAALAGVFMLFSTAALAVVTVNAPWVRPTPDRTATEAYLRLTSTEDATLKEVRSTLATSVVIRAAGSKSRTLPQLALPAGVPVVLTIEAADGSRHAISVNADVRLRPPADDERRAHPR
jgi:copper(I)-binding protein